MSEKVSIIVPVYNVEKYIKKCVQSLLNQDYSNIEIILVDDGSPDKSGFIIDELKKNDSRIEVIHKENNGVSSARNAGLSLATGEYVTFVDGDDWVEPEYVSYFVKLLEKTNCDIAMNKNNFTEKQVISANKHYIVDSEKAIEWIYNGNLFVAVWNKMYKKKIFDENNIKFNKDIWYGEGMLFNIECLQFVDRVVVGEKAVYHQTYNPESAMRKFNLESQLCGLKSLDIQKDIWTKSNINIENSWMYHKYRFNRTIIDGLVRTNAVKDNRNAYCDCIHNLRKNIGIPLKNEKKFKTKLAWCGYFIAPYFMAVIDKAKRNIILKKINQKM